MKNLTAISIILLFCLGTTGIAYSNGPHCETTGGITLQILGSGGPIAIAAETGAGKLVLSHFMARSLYNLEANLNEIHSRYTGTVVIAHDLDCVEI